MPKDRRLTPEERDEVIALMQLYHNNRPKIIARKFDITRSQAHRIWRCYKEKLSRRSRSTFTQPTTRC